jgi:hypothetical protein
MINLRQLYEIAPELKKNQKIPKTTKAKSKIQKIDLDKSSQNFRKNLLSNLLSFRSQKESSFQTHLYECASRKSMSSVRSSLNPSTFSHFTFEDTVFLTEKQSKKLKKTQKIEKGLISSLQSEKIQYQRDLAYQLRSTLPRFLESSRKKALRKIS